MMAPFGLVSVKLAFCVCVGLNLQKKSAFWTKIDSKTPHHQLGWTASEMLSLPLNSINSLISQPKVDTNILPHLTQIQVIIVTLLF